VARIIVPEKDGVSLGSGTLVDVRGQFGLVVTNWHVVRDAAGPIRVEFPGGFQSAAEVVKTDRDWDLAALSISRPHCSPVRISAIAPRPGESLTIAGYGSGDWRMATGPCTQYLAPGVDFPHEMVELATEARQGDSGGPIFNQQGELAGVLFGSGPGYTSGSYGGRVLQFLATVVPGGRPGSDDPPHASSLAAGPAGSTPPGIDTPRPLLAAQPDPVVPSTTLQGPPPQATALHAALPEGSKSADPPAPALGVSRPAEPGSADLAGRAKQPDEESLTPALTPLEPAPLAPAATDAPPTARLLVPPPIGGESADRLASAALPAAGSEPAPPASGWMHNPLPPRHVPASSPSGSLADAPAAQLVAALWKQIGGTSAVDQLKTALAIIGGLTLLAIFWRLGSQPEPLPEED
jgi:hypothetical protein